MRKPISDWYKELAEKQNVELNISKEIFNDFIEIYYRRNIIVHNQGIVNEVYNKNVKNKLKKGEVVSADLEYLEKAFTTTQIVIIATIWGLRKLLDNINKIIDDLFEYGFNCMLAKKWELSIYVFESLLQEKSNESDTMTNKVNLWISKKNLNGLDSIREEIEELDVSAMEQHFKIAKSALLDNFDDVSKELDEVIGTKFPGRFVKEWPLFIQYRESIQYKKFIKKHEGLFGMKGFEKMEREEQIMQDFENKNDGDNIDK